jgi:hypothetical protein
VDPDTAFQVNPDPIRIQGFDDQKLKKINTAGFFIYIFLIKNGKLPMSKLQEKLLALKRENPAHPDPGAPLNPDPRHCI